MPLVRNIVSVQFCYNGLSYACRRIGTDIIYIKLRVIETRWLQHIHNVLVSYKQASILQSFPED